MTVRRAQVVDMSRRGYSAPEIAEALDATSDWVRGVIHDFNTIGLEALVPAWSGGRPRTITTEMRARIVEVVDSHPQELGEPYATWSLSTLRAYLLKTAAVRTISKERLRVILHEEGRATVATRSWKRSPDPDFCAKAARLRRLYRLAETGRLDGVLVCFDEHGPVTPTPKHGRHWAPFRRPRRLPANYRKPHGVAFFFGCYDVGADQLFGRWFRRKGADYVMTTLRMIRARYHRERIWVVQDNLSSHWTKEVRALAFHLGIVLVSTPTYASWLNRIECHFGVMVKAVFAGSNYTDHDEIQAASSAWLRRRNAEARRDRDARRAARQARRRRRERARRPQAAA
ncbi:MAG TPA: IS630 family transposase [Acidimicrobiales bacterium]|nr:IS630 family transposase [Acidimicrobiales bacterium]